jgi:hypothetical protein
MAVAVTRTAAVAMAAAASASRKAAPACLRGLRQHNADRPARAGGKMAGGNRRRTPWRRPRVPPPINQTKFQGPSGPATRSSAGAPVDYVHVALKAFQTIELSSAGCFLPQMKQRHLGFFDGQLHQGLNQHVRAEQVCLIFLP